MMGIQLSECWDSIVVKYAETSRNTYQEWREARPNQARFRQLLKQFAENCRLENCKSQMEYIQSMGMKEKENK